MGGERMSNWAQPIIDVVPIYIEAGEGYLLFDHALYNPTELSREVIGFAVLCGFPLSADDIEAVGYYDDETLGSIEYDAINYLNDHHAPSGSWWGHEGYAGAFGCWPITEDAA